ncbi:hypothetical protein NQ317_002617 [Molorchus minor]|uniref:Double jelly roll-like domain-containing protein n=1 Tax=Molorchus minor TaxID=1323400 RepID=A0ABQ9JTH2_9CUCU|nr:hypothetical protein NQ317_002617 [Molorchus minor]
MSTNVMGLLNITGQPYSDSFIEDYQFHSYQTYISGNIGFNDEIRIPIQDLDAYTAPGDSYLYIEGKLLQENGNKPVKLEFINNGVSFLFRELRYELNGIVVDSVRNVGLTSTLKNYLSYNENESVVLQNAGWFPKKIIPTDLKTNPNDTKIISDDDGNFNVSIPLKFLAGFFEDFQKIIVNMKQELVLIRSSNDLDCIYSNDLNELPKITITKLFWKVPHVSVSMVDQLRLTKLLNKNVELPIRFRSWELIEYPALPHSTNHTWHVKTSTKVETPRHVIIAFQENVKGKVNSDMSKFTNCDRKNVRVFLNSERYPYSDLFLSFTSNKFAALYDMFANFQESYYPYKIKQPIFTPTEFNTIAPIAHIDCSHQKGTGPPLLPRRVRRAPGPKMGPEVIKGAHGRAPGPTMGPRVTVGSKVTILNLTYSSGSVGTPVMYCRAPRPQNGAQYHRGAPRSLRRPK